ncbi:hypothetical protein SAMN02745225_02313 [Ferrithrix thermotolerans DSM 19514]|uniref:Uncharacterized protein n=1 Tax=Ferrithrix thermotolerans DSM 19514 TaxID=1121881 RepID=A0A1M4YDU0_9ACTN|nr:hypothetical protein [Ferrithrix thermotolerans]SHF03899.1 hypothetical protein SAMN02745225_02313 [Ferrithrix thermotolerans DSM 19514]
MGILCLASAPNLGIDDPEFREKIGEDKITLFARHGQKIASPSVNKTKHRTTDQLCELVAQN